MRDTQQPWTVKEKAHTPKIYFACLSAYNNGKLHGVWIEANQPKDAIWDAIHAMLKNSPERDAEEWAIHDYEGFYDLRLSEWEGIERVTALAAFTLEHGELGAELVKHCGDLDEAKTAIEENYAGAYKTLADFARGLTEETTAIPQNLAYYVDYEAMARDMELNGDVFTIQTGFEEVHVFWGR